MSTITVNSLISEALESQYDLLIHTLSVFFNYIILDRDGYFLINNENISKKHIGTPKLNDIMVKYVIITS